LVYFPLDGTKDEKVATKQEFFKRYIYHNADIV